jgi:hypothetical protein
MVGYGLSALIVGASPAGTYSEASVAPVDMFTSLYKKTCVAKAWLHVAAVQIIHGQTHPLTQLWQCL